MDIKLRLLHKAVLTLDGKNIEVERIGRGRFTTAWRNCENVYAHTREDDSGKEILRDLTPMRHIPEVRQLGTLDGYRLYVMPLYKPLTAKARVAWNQYKAVASIASETHRLCIRKIPWNERLLACDYNARFLEMLSGTPGIEPSLVEAIEALVDKCLDYGDYSIEIAKRNCAVGAEGELILLDPVFDLKALQDKRHVERRKYRGY